MSNGRCSTIRFGGRRGIIGNRNGYQKFWDEDGKLRQRQKLNKVLEKEILEELLDPKLVRIQKLTTQEINVVIVDRRGITFHK